MRKYLVVLAILAVCVCAAALLQFPASANEPTYNVMSYGAVGNGITDDTTAIRNTITAAGVGGTVLLPRGTYRISNSLTLDRVHLLGYTAGGWPCDDQVLPTILVTQTNAPAIICLSSSSVHGVYFKYNVDPYATPTVYQPTIRLSGTGVSISNVKTYAAYDGIIADGTNNIGRINIENVFMLETIHMGIYLTKAYDVPTLRNIELTGGNSNLFNSGTGIKLGRLDELHASKIYVACALRAYEFFNDTVGTGGATYGSMAQCSSGGCQAAYWILAPVGIHITDSRNVCHFEPITVDNTEAVVDVTGGLQSSNGDHTVRVLNCHSFIMTGTRVQHGVVNNGIYGLYVTGGRSVVVTGCTFDGNSPGAYLAGSPTKIIVTNNIFEGNGVYDYLGGGVLKIIGSNL